jgi:hypothetical protein
VPDGKSANGVRERLLSERLLVFPDSGLDRKKVAVFLSCVPPPGTSQSPAGIRETLAKASLSKTHCSFVGAKTLDPQVLKKKAISIWLVDQSPAAHEARFGINPMKSSNHRVGHRSASRTTIHFQQVETFEDKDGGRYSIRTCESCNMLCNQRITGNARERSGILRAYFSTRARKMDPQMDPRTGLASSFPSTRFCILAVAVLPRLRTWPLLGLSNWTHLCRFSNNPSRYITVQNGATAAPERQTAE